MNSTEVKSIPEALREVDIDQLLTHRLRQDQEQIRVRRIARAGHLWMHRRLLGKFAGWGAAASLLIAFLIPSRYASDNSLDAARFVTRAGHGHGCRALGGCWRKSRLARQ